MSVKSRESEEDTLPGSDRRRSIRVRIMAVDGARDQGMVVQ